MSSGGACGHPVKPVLAGPICRCEKKWVEKLVPPVKQQWLDFTCFCLRTVIDTIHLPLLPCLGWTSSGKHQCKGYEMVHFQQEETAVPYHSICFRLQIYHLTATISSHTNAASASYTEESRPHLSPATNMLLLTPPYNSVYRGNTMTRP